VTEFTLSFSSTLSYPISGIILHTFIQTLHVLSLADIEINQEIEPRNKKEYAKRHKIYLKNLPIRLN